MAPKSRKRNAQDAPSASHVPDTTEPTFDAIRFRSQAYQQHFFEWVENRIPIVEVPFQFHASEFPNITAEVERRGWQYLCNPIQGRLGDVLRDICEDYAEWKLDIKGNPSQLKRRDLKPTAKGWFDFVRRSLMPTSNANEVIVDRAVLVHSIMEGLSIKVELLISNHISAAAESKDPNKRFPFTGVIYRLLFANGFKKKVQGDKLIPIEKPITAESIIKKTQQEGQQQIPPQVHHQFPPQEHHQVHEEEDEQEQQHQQEQHFQQHPQQFNFPQPPPQNFPQEYNWQELTQQFQGMRVEQNNHFKDFFDQQNSFFEDMRTQTRAYKQGFEDLRVQQHKYVDEIKAIQEITHQAVLELKKNQDKHQKELAPHRKEYKEHSKAMKEAMEKQNAQFQTANQYWHRINSKNEENIDYLCWGIQQINPYLKARLPEDIPE
ncbi:hypothetical protein PIB30_042522 [Stylosanthes scabra]|uniref:Putative plant transposon protein domain-containing protein n=1 Tax=Stylosanthes scabra TaxID=79078 RepID=A0ABU6TEV1_9FABA|nr:hypothetical protein [Stylosanthes scabra]